MTTSHDTILVVDDEEPVRQVLRALLETEGFRVLEAEDAKACLHTVYQRRPDLVLLDIVMPGRDGREVCRLLREIDPHLPVIMLTALFQEQEKVERLSEGADDYVTKPFDRKELRARVQVGERVALLQVSLAERIHQLEDALAKVKQLQGLLPICAYCKKIRDDKAKGKDDKSDKGAKAKDEKAKRFYDAAADSSYYCLI